MDGGGPGWHALRLGAAGAAGARPSEPGMCRPGEHGGRVLLLGYVVEPELCQCLTTNMTARI